MEKMSNYERVKEWRARNKDKVAAQARRYRAAYPEQVKAVKDAYRERSKNERLPREAAKARQRRAADPEGQKRRNQAYQERQRALKESVAGRAKPECCELCGESGKIVFDHCHAHGHFRGWICDRCNKVLGLVYDRPNLLRMMASYLEDKNVEDEGDNAKLAA